MIPTFKAEIFLVTMYSGWKLSTAKMLPQLLYVSTQSQPLISDISHSVDQGHV